MGFEIEFSKQAQQDIIKLSSQDKVRILKKLKYFSETPDPLYFAVALTNAQLGHYRFRVGDYRIIIDIKDEIIVVLKIGHRREVYR